MYLDPFQCMNLTSHLIKNEGFVATRLLKEGPRSNHGVTKSCVLQQLFTCVAAANEISALETQEGLQTRLCHCNYAAQ